MYKSIIAAFLLSSTVVQADIIKCTFLGPPKSLLYDTDANELIVTNNFTQKSKTLKSVGLVFTDKNEFKLISKHGKTLARFKATYEGSDGATPCAYPYEATYKDQVGGCTSQKLWAKDCPFPR